MKQQEFTKCVYCNKGMAEDGRIAFYKLTIECMVLNIGAIRRQAGLEMMLNGNGRLASAMGADEDLAQPVGEARTALVCSTCGLKQHALAEILEKG